MYLKHKIKSGIVQFVALLLFFALAFGATAASTGLIGNPAEVTEKGDKSPFDQILRPPTTTTTTTTPATPAAKAEEKYSPATEEILKAIAELMKLGTQLRTQQEMAVENPAAKSEESVPAFAGNESVDDEEELETAESEDAELDAEDRAEKETNSDSDDDGDDGDYEHDQRYDGGHGAPLRAYCARVVRAEHLVALRMG